VPEPVTVLQTAYLRGFLMILPVTKGVTMRYQIRYVQGFVTPSRLCSVIKVLRATAGGLQKSKVQSPCRTNVLRAAEKAILAVPRPKAVFTEFFFIP